MLVMLVVLVLEKISLSFPDGNMNSAILSLSSFLRSNIVLSYFFPLSQH